MGADFRKEMRRDFAMIGGRKTRGALSAGDAAYAVEVQQYIVGGRCGKCCGHWRQACEILADLNWRLHGLCDQGRVMIVIVPDWFFDPVRSFSIQHPYCIASENVSA